MLSIWQGSSCFNGVGRVNAECRRVHGRCSARSVACRVQRACCMLHARIRSLTGPAPVVPLKFCGAHDGGKAEDALRLRARGLPRRRARHALRVARCAGSRCTGTVARCTGPRRPPGCPAQSRHRKTERPSAKRQHGCGTCRIRQRRRRVVDLERVSLECLCVGVHACRNRAAVRTRAVLGVFYYTAQGRGQLRVLRVL